MRFLPGLAVSLLLLAGCAAPSDPDASPSSTTAATTQPPATPTGPSPAKDTFNLTPFLTGLESPIHITHAGDGSGRLFLVERAGKIRIVKDGVLESTPFLDISAKVRTAGEGGLLSVAFYPDYGESGRFIVDYTRAGPGATVPLQTIVARFTVSGDPNVADPQSEEILLTIDQPQANHNGGLVKFGPDGMLYIGSGDGGGSGDLGPGHAPEGNGQNLQSLLGKLLRIDVRGAGPYKVPDDNPNLGPNARREIWAYGLRNPWRFSFDRVTGDLYIGDVGQNAWEEIDYQPRSSKGGENYGWPQWEGTHLYPHPGPGVVGDTKPVAEYGNPAQGCSVTGGYVYRGSKIPAIASYYFLGDYCKGDLWTLAKVDGAWSLTHVLDTPRAIVSFGEDEAGELYLVDLAGSVHRFEPV